MSIDTSPVYSPRFELSFAGETYQEAGGLISNIVVETTVDGADLCQFQIDKPYDPEHHDFLDLSWGDIEPGTDIELKMGWGGSGSIKPVFKGTSQSMRTEFNHSQGASVSVAGYGKLHEMMSGVNERSWTESTVSDVAEEVIGEYFGTVEVDGPGIERPTIVQHGENDYRFIRALADDYGFEFFAERDTAYFTPRGDISSGDPVATLTYGNALDSFSAEITKSDQTKEVEVRYWDMAAEKEVVGKASGSEGEGKMVFRVLCDSKKEADRIAESKLSELQMSRARGHGEADGNPEITAGKILELDEVGERFSKNYYITRAAHRMTGSGYRTTFEVKEIPE